MVVVVAAAAADVTATVAVRAIAVTTGRVARAARTVIAIGIVSLSRSPKRPSATTSRGTSSDHGWRRQLPCVQVGLHAGQSASVSQPLLHSAESQQASLVQPNMPPSAVTTQRARAPQSAGVRQGGGVVPSDSAIGSATQRPSMQSATREPQIGGVHVWVRAKSAHSAW